MMLNTTNSEKNVIAGRYRCGEDAKLGVTFYLLTLENESFDDPHMQKSLAS
jgi:hypothetical protein